MIKVLEKNVSDKIAAGEVIERPLSIVKELIENSIDAGACSITCEIKNGGKSYIRVTDDGCGMESDELEIAFLRHATSKISSEDDLRAIHTLGFRGEALASIAAVTRTEVISKTNDSKMGTQLIIHGGEVIEKKSTGCPKGTTFIITDLFFNTPAREKFMKSDSAESSIIIEFVSQIALTNSNIRFRLVNNGKVLLSTTGDGDTLSIITQAYPSIESKNLVPLEYKENDISITGFISNTGMTRPSRRNHYFFVNGRVINSKVIEKGITIGYKERLFEGRYPVVFLFICMNPSSTDVNIHPNKREVRFDREDNIIDLISKGIKQSLSTKESTVNVSNVFLEKHNTYPIHELKEMVQESQTDIKSLLSTLPIEDKKLDYSATNTCSPSLEKNNFDINIPGIIPFDMRNLSIKGTIFNTYIMATDESNFYLFDQHACHERIYYEKFVNSFFDEEKVKQPILTPFIFNVDVSIVEFQEEWLGSLYDMGFTIDSFGMNSFRVSEIPPFMTLKEAEDFINEFVAGDNQSFRNWNTVVIDKLILKSCKAAIKAHDYIGDDEIQSLFAQLMNCANPFSCPHGRPTYIKLSLYEIERLFKRV